MRYIISQTLASLLALPAASLLALPTASLLAFPAAAEVPRVVTDIPPVGALVAQVMGDLGAPAVLLGQDGDPHAFQLRPSQAADLAAAQVVIWVGPDLTPWLERAMAGTSAQDLRLLALPGTTLRGFAEGHDTPDSQDHAADDHAGDAHEAEAAHDHGDTDPHAWLDPANAATWLTAIAATLTDLDPANAATYAANAAQAQTAVQKLDAELQAQLAPVRHFPLVVFHNAYGYFAGHYSLNVIGAISDGDAASPGAARLRDLQARLGASEVCLFPEANHDPRLLATLAEAPGVRIGAPLDPEGANLPPGPALYGDLMRSMAGAIADCAAAKPAPAP